MLRFLLSALIYAVPASPVTAEVIAGPISVIDADTLEVGDVRVRLYGIDAPEIGQTCLLDGANQDCGRWAKRQTTVLYQGRQAACQRVTTDKYGRAVARCLVNGQDIAARLVADGLAQAYRRYALDYVDQEKAASIAGLGIWQGDMQAPSDFRAARVEVAPTGCDIKGNISGNGKIYHLPGQKNYARTRISVGKGERWFCTEAGARVAGWRKARR